MPVMPGGIANFSRPAQPENALLPMFVTLFGIATSVKPTQPEKAESPIFARPSGRDTRLAAEHPSMKPKNNLSVPGRTTTSDRFQYASGKSPESDTTSPRSVTDRIDEHPEKGVNGITSRTETRP